MSPSDAHRPRLNRRAIAALVVLLVMAVIAGGLSWRLRHLDIGPHVEHAGGIYAAFRTDPWMQRVVRRITGGMASTQHSIRFAPGRVSDDWLARHRFRIDALDRLSLTLSSPAITDAGVEQLATANGLVWLDLSQSQVTDAGLLALTELPLLTTLHLEETSVTDAVIPDLIAMPRLQSINLAGTAITDLGLSSLPPGKIMGLGLDSKQLTDRVVGSPPCQSAFFWFGLYDATDESVALLSKLSIKGSLLIQGDGLTEAGLKDIENLILGGQLHAVEFRDVSIAEERLQALRKLNPSCSVQAGTTEELERILDRSRPVSNDSIF